LRAGITDTGLRNDAVRRLVGTADTAAAADVRWEPLLVAARQEQAVVTQPNRADPLADVTRYRIARAALDTACDAVP
jgi:hypothetical protein